MIQIIIFSFNRALQLEALLASIFKYWSNVEYKVSILYNTTDQDFQKGYDLLESEYDCFEFVKESRQESFFHFSDYFSLFNLKKLLKYPYMRKQKSNFRDLLNEILDRTTCQYTMFLTDDSAFIRDVLLSVEDLKFIDSDPEQYQISLRLGKDITQRPNDIPVEDGKLVWSFSEHRKARSWGYNFSVDAHIYSTNICRRLLNRIIFSNPTTLEDNICSYVKQNGFWNRGMTFENPFVLSFPLNMVQQIANNESMNLSSETLNHYFLDGYRLLYPVIDSIVEFQQYPDSVNLYKNEEHLVLFTH